MRGGSFDCKRFSAGVQHRNFTPILMMRWPCLKVVSPNTGSFCWKVFLSKLRPRFPPLKEHRGWFRKL